MFNVIASRRGTSWTVDSFDSLELAKDCLIGTLQLSEYAPGGVDAIDDCTVWGDTDEGGYDCMVYGAWEYDHADETHRLVVDGETIIGG